MRLSAAKYIVGCAFIPFLLVDCGGGSSGAEPAAAASYPNVAQYLNLDLNTPANYGAASLPVHYDATVLATSNQPVSPPASDAVATVGRVLFHDRRLSVNDMISCASCHIQINGFADPNRFSTGFAGGQTTAHSMRLGNAAFYTGAAMFWNKRAASLEEQAIAPIENATEMGFDAAHGGLAALITKMQALPYYPELFVWAFGDATISQSRLETAIAQFERAMISANSKWDRAYAVVYSASAPNKNLGAPLSGNNIPVADRFTASEENGRLLFMRSPAQGGKGCAGCHQPPTFALDANSRSNGLDAGETTVFKSPSLKNVALAGAFMHDGRFNTLDAVLTHYATGIQAGPAKDNRLPVGGLSLSPIEQADIVAFLGTLTDTALTADTRFSNPFIR